MSKAKRRFTVRRVLLSGALATTLLGSGPAALALPSNDDVAGATEIPGVPSTVTGDATGASTQLGEPLPACALDAETVWFRFTPAGPARLVADTFGSKYDTVLAVYAGTGIGDLVPVACNDDATDLGSHQSRVSFVGEMGTTYFLQVGAFGGTQAGPVRVTLSGHVQVTPFVSYPAPDSFRYANDAGETSIGVNPATNNVMFQMMLDTARVSFDDTQDPPVATWLDVTPPTSVMTMDPIMWTDRTAERTFVLHLAERPSIGAYTNDDGDSWIPIEPPSVPPSWDHETIGGGPYAGPVPPGLGIAYPNALYYCAQSGYDFSGANGETGLSQCARSDTGGLTWGAPLPMNVLGCFGIHGHVAVGPDGSVYIPHGRCRDGDGVDRQGLLVSRDNGVTWGVRVVPGTLARTDIFAMDPKISFDAAGRLYFAGGSAGRPFVSTSTDGGETWSEPADVAGSLGIASVVFPAVAAGDASRAAMSFYGTTTPGDDQSAGFDGVWHLYVAFTFDGGASWTLYDATPDDPVQRGCIWLSGGSSPCRNLLDFQDMTVDAEGRVLVGYADGCTSAQCVGPSGTPGDSRDGRGKIARQVWGKRLFAAFDP